MKVVGERFGSGEMQLPFVLQSAETMKTAVALLEPHMEKSDASGKGKIVLATVRGDVHDIGKNLVDIILTNNGYDVVNLGIKQPIADIIAAAEEHNADVIGMSGLLVKSTVVMKENLQELQSRGLAKRWPVILGGAALTRAYVEDDLAGQFDGEVRYARDAFEGLTLMEPLVKIARGAAPDEVGLPPLKKRIHSAGAKLTLTEPEAMPARSDVASDNPVPVPPFWGTRIVAGHRARRLRRVPRRARDLHGAVGAQARTRRRRAHATSSSSTTEGRPRLRYWLDRILAEGMLDASVAYGYFPVVSRGRRPRRAPPRRRPVRRPRGGGAARPRRRLGRCARHRPTAVPLPAAAPRPAPVPRGLRAVPRVGPDRRDGGAAGDGRLRASTP